MLTVQQLLQLLENSITDKMTFLSCKIVLDAKAAKINKVVWYRFAFKVDLLPHIQSLQFYN